MTQLIDSPVAYEQATHVNPSAGIDSLECAFYAKSSFAESQEGEPFAPTPNTEISPSENADLADLPEVRHDKISVLKAAIANGTYHVSAEALADKLIEGLLR